MSLEGKVRDLIIMLNLPIVDDDGIRIGPLSADDQRNIFLTAKYLNQHALGNENKIQDASPVILAFGYSLPVHAQDIPGANPGRREYQGFLVNTAEGMGYQYTGTFTYRSLRAFIRRQRQIEDSLHLPHKPTVQLYIYRARPELPLGERIKLGRAYLKE